MKPVIRFFAFLCFVFLFSTRLFAQAPGDLDTSFHFRTNYGALFPIEKAWPLADGTIMCYTHGGNYFSGKKTGNYFKIKPDGELDSDYESPPFTLQCDLCSCTDNESSVVTRNGSVYISSRTGIKINGTVVAKSLIKLDSLGHIDTSLIQNEGFGSGFDKLLHLPTYGILRLGNHRVAYLTENFQQDSSQGFVQFQTDEWLQPSAISNQFTTIFTLDSSEKRFLIPFDHNTHSFGERILKKRSKGIIPIIVGIDPENRLYEFYYQHDTVSGQIFHRIVRRKSNDQLDSLYQILIQKPLIPNFRIDDEGYLLMALQETRFVRFEKSNGAILDTILTKPNEILTFDNHKIILGKTKGNRWAFEKQTLSGQVILHKESQFGPNGSIQKVLTDLEGRALIAGDFTEVDGWTSPRLARIGSNGLVDTTFHCSTLLTSDSGKVTYLEYLPHQNQILLVGSKPFGMNNRFLYRLDLDGTVDTSFAKSNLSGYIFPVQKIFGAHIIGTGSILLTIRFNDPADTSNSWLIKLKPNGELDPQFQIRSFNPWFQGSLGLGLKPYVSKISTIQPNILKLSIESEAYSGIYPCSIRKPSHVTSAHNYTLFDTLGNGFPLVPIMQAEFGKMWDVPDLSGNNSSLFLSLYPQPFSSQWFRVGNDLLLDSTFKMLPTLESRNYLPTARLKDQSYLFEGYEVYPNIEFLGEDQMGTFYFFEHQSRLKKIKPDGSVDSSFNRHLYYGGINSVAEPDSSHLYIAGGFQVRNYEVVPPLVRIHNARSTVTANIQKRSEQNTVRIYPNPIRETLFLSGWKPGTELMVTNVQGKVMFHETVTESIRTESLRLLPGFYFWKATRNGSTQGFGKLVKE
ncbi:MAG TPA: T9SS type A sorting domain-containing protein [Catalimonadaceae bacterium]|nr:T9SS type A sorting domain-containing protein [Catalimonadaceae bacterium]